mmetsp:Transcript_118934/g.206527  ORF Transcript_118934/g.206527 Transcript_118934/m.206527 type:complete len:241 (-) Transcript_118934:1304-2026(-)
MRQDVRSHLEASFSIAALISHAVASRERRDSCSFHPRCISCVTIASLLRSTRSRARSSATVPSLFKFRSLHSSTSASFFMRDRGTLALSPEALLLSMKPVPASSDSISLVSSSTASGFSLSPSSPDVVTAAARRSCSSCDCSASARDSEAARACAVSWAFASCVSACRSSSRTRATSSLRSLLTCCCSSLMVAMLASSCTLDSANSWAAASTAISSLSRRTAFSVASPVSCASINCPAAP